MDRTGRAFPSQQLIAKGMRGSVKTVQRHIEIARRDGWICIETAGRGGKGWRHYAYLAAIPHQVQLDDLDESIADAIESQQGGIEGGDTIVSPRKGPSRICPADVHRTTSSVIASVTEADGVRHDRGDIGYSKVATNDAEGGDISGTSWRHNGVALSLLSELPPKVTRASEEAHNAQSRVASAPPETCAREKARRVRAHSRSSGESVSRTPASRHRAEHGSR